MIIPQEQILNLHQSIETLALIVDLQQLEKNIEAMQNLANENAVRLRPHIKTHKSGQSIRLGSPVIIIPNHACAVANLYSHYHLVDSSGKIKQIPVDARGKSQ
jgi:D-serine deaminase-like pyridoxal phosphate-dependent protein